MSAGYPAAPVRYPDTSSPGMMAKRGWWLVILGALIPGSAQVLAGNRRLGRFGLGATLTLWFLAVVAAVAWFAFRTVTIGIATNTWVLLAGQVVLVFYAGLWLVLAVNTLRLTRLVAARPMARFLIAGFAVVLLVGTVGTTAYGAYLTGVARSALEQVFADGEYAEPVDGRYNILLLGGDAGRDRVGLRPDSISVVSIDAASGATTIIGVPRNLTHAPFSAGSPLYGPFPNGYDCGNECLISYLYTYGQENEELYPDAAERGSSPGVEATRDAVEGALGMQLQYYVLIDMKGFRELVDALGGVTITVQDRVPIGGGKDPQGGDRPIEGWIEPGEQLMDGFTALWYARSRETTSDYDRMRRQREVQEAILHQFEPANVLTKFQAVAEASSQIVETDIPQSMLGRFVGLAEGSREQDPTRLELVPPLVDVTAPDFADIQRLVDDATEIESSGTSGG